MTKLRRDFLIIPLLRFPCDDIPGIAAVCEFQRKTQSGFDIVVEISIDVMKRLLIQWSFHEN